MNKKVLDYQYELIKWCFEELENKNVEKYHRIRKVISKHKPYFLADIKEWYTYYKCNLLYDSLHYELDVTK